MCALPFSFTLGSQQKYKSTFWLWCCVDWICFDTISLKPQCQSLGKSAVRIIYCCRTIKWLLADKSRCVQCVQQKAEREREKLLQMERMLHFAPNLTAQHPFSTSCYCFHNKRILHSGPKSRQSLPGDPWLVWSCKHTKTNQCTLILLSKTFPFFLCQSSFSADKLYGRIWFPRPESPGKYHGKMFWWKL